MIVSAIALALLSGFPGCGTPHSASDRAWQEAQKQLADARAALADLRKENEALKTQLAQAQAELSQLKARLETAPTFPVAPNFAGVEPAAADSVEGQLAAQGKTWKRINVPIVPGTYVEDILEGRLNQPKGRGRIGKVTAVAPDGAAATVDFGRGYSPGIFLRELSPVGIEPAPRF
jgi:hypothetical protein